MTSVSANPGQRVMLNYAGNACEAGDLVRCLPDSPKPVSPKHDSPKLGFRVRVWGYGLWLRVRVSVSANRVSAKRVSANRD